MKTTLKIALASVLVANSASAMSFVAGGSFGVLGNTFKKNYKDHDGNTISTKNNISSAYFGLEGGAIFDIANSFAMSSELFLGMNTLKEGDSKGDGEIKQGLTFGLQTRAIYSVMENAKLYGKLGLGMTKVSFKVNTLDLSKNSMFLALGLGMEFAMMDQMTMFTEFEYSMPFSKLEDTKIAPDFNVKISSNYGLKVGVRYFF